MDAVILVNKPLNYTSNDIVRIAKKVLKISKVGHTGTLDPLASGLLVLVSGKLTKLASEIEEGYKEYIATITFGKDSLTLDGEGPFSKEKKVKVHTLEKIKKVLNTFLNDSYQMPPAYSALKVNGVRAYKLARSNKKVKLQKRLINIKEIKLINYDKNSITFSCICSKGTYIRSLCYDISKKLKNKGYMSYLKRIKIGEFNIKDSNELDNLKNNNYKFINVNEYFKDYDEVLISDENNLKEIISGNLSSINKVGKYVIKNQENKIIAYVNNNKFVLTFFNN